MQYDRRPKIPVVCVSSHQHVLEHIHDILRRRRLLAKSWTMLHFDSHADLACPGEHIPAACCFQPRRAVRVGRKTTEDVNDPAGEDDVGNNRNLYELLDSSASGIAEWILPLVLAANLSDVHWIRPSTTVRLIPSGCHTYHVGAWIHGNHIVEAPERIRSFLDLPETATVKVDWNCAYYAEDGSCVPCHELVMARPLRLTVEEKSISSTAHQTINNLNHATTSEYIFALDVCLDFFACLNPFVVDLEAIDEEFAHALVAVVIGAELYKHEEEGVAIATTTLHSDNCDVATFRPLLQTLLEACDNHTSSVLDTEFYRDLTKYYSSKEKARDLIERIAALLQKHDDNRPELIQMAIEALPNLTMPHERTLNDRGWEMGNRSIEHRLKILDNTINSNQYQHCDPFIITVARSCDDGFTPPSVVEELQESVMKTIHKRYCGCREPNLRPEMFDSSSSRSNCRFDLIFDYGQWEGSTFSS